MTNTKKKPERTSFASIQPKTIEKKIRQSYRAMHWAIIGLTILLTLNYVFFLKHGLNAHP